MSVLHLKTRSEVCLPFPPGSDPDLRYDIPRDCLGFPFLPFSALPDSLNPFPELPRPGFGLLKDLDALVFAVEGIALSRQVFPRFVSDRFTAIRTVRGCPCRVLKAGLEFVCSVDVADADFPEVERRLSALTHVGVRDGSVAGEVELSLSQGERPRTAARLPLPRTEPRYRRLHYSVRLRTPLCSYRPYDRLEKGRDFISGTVMRNWIRERLGARFGEFASGGGLRCANAYLSIEGRRSFPPVCGMAQRRDEKSVVEYRLSPDFETATARPAMTKPLRDNVGDLSSTVFACDRPKMKIAYLGRQENPELSGWGNRRLMLREHQLFRGYFEGKDSQIRILAGLLASDGVAHLGDYTDEGFGECVIRTESFETDDGKPASYLGEFDVVLLSDAIFYNRFGCSDASREAFQDAVEKALGAHGRLSYVSGSASPRVHADVDPKTGAQSTRIRVVHAGSALRLRVCDGNPVDVSALNGGFLGDRNREGFGEVLVLPARDNRCRYVRTAERERTVSQGELSNSQVLRAATFAAGVTGDLMRYGVSLLAANDAKDGGEIDDGILRAVLDGIKSRYDESVGFETMKGWYREALAAHRAAGANWKGGL
mgnify:CR=1 FL=1